MTFLRQEPSLHAFAPSWPHYARGSEECIYCGAKQSEARPCHVLPINRRVGWRHALEERKLRVAEPSRRHR